MDLERRYELCVRDLEEVIAPDELHHLLETVDHPKGYVGFECSGLMHAGTGLIVGRKMLDWVEAGFDFRMGMPPGYDPAHACIDIESNVFPLPTYIDRYVRASLEVT